MPSNRWTAAILGAALVSAGLGPATSGEIVAAGGSLTASSSERVLQTSTFFGGRRDDYIRDVTRDDRGNTYVVGVTYSNDLPTEDAYDTGCSPQRTDCTDGFLAKFGPQGDLLMSSYIGGSDADYAGEVALGPDGSIYVGGNTTSHDFPVTPGAFDEVCGVDGRCGDNNNPVPRPDAWVARFSSGGALMFATFLGAGYAEQLSGLAVDASGAPIVAGYTQSYEFPTTQGAHDTTHNGIGYDDGFVTKLSPTADRLVYSTYFGGYHGDEINDLAIDPAGAAYVTGVTFSRDLPTTPGVLGPGCSIDSPSCYEGFAAKLNPTGSALDYSTYLTGANESRGIAVDDSGHAFVVGESRSLRTTSGAFQERRRGRAYDAYVIKLDPQARRYVYATYFGGGADDGTEVGIDIDIDDRGRAFITGYTLSSNLPVKQAVQPAPGGGSCSNHPCADVFVAGFSADASNLLFATYLGGRLPDHGSAVSPLGGGKIAAVGRTWSPNFPTRNAFDRTFGGEDCPHPTALECSDGWFSVIAAGQTEHRRHGMRIGLWLRRHLVARGRVRPRDGSRHCRKDILVRIQIRAGGRWRTVTYTHTDREGRYRVALLDQTRRHRAVAIRRAYSRRQASLFHVCRSATSPTRRHSH